jgi:hypothetical protein
MVQFQLCEFAQNYSYNWKYIFRTAMNKLLLLSTLFLILQNSLTCFKIELDDDRMHQWRTQDFLRFYSHYFSLTKLVDITTIINTGEVHSYARFFCNELIRTILKPGTAVRIDIKDLNGNLDTIPDPTFTKFLNDNFVLDYNFTQENEKPEVIRVTRIRKLNYATEDKRVCPSHRYASEVGKGKILIFWSFNVLKIFLNGSFVLSLENRRSLHAIFILNVESNSMFRSNIGEILLQLWTKFHILNVVVYTPVTSEDVYIYRPFKKTYTSWGIVNVYKLRSINGLEILNCLEDLEKYPIRVKIFSRLPTALSEIPKNMQDNRIHTDLYKYSGFGGVDGNVLGELAKQMNFSVLTVYKQQRNFGKILKPGRITGSLGYIVYDLIDLVANGMFVTDQKTGNFEFTNVYFYDEICVVAPKAERIPHWLAVFKCFHWQTWIFLTCTCLVSLLFWFIFDNVYQFGTKGTFKYNLIDVFLILVSAPIKLHHLKGKNTFLASCMIFNAVITWTFQGNLVKSFSTKSYYADINTLEQLDKSGLAISTSLNVFENYHNSTLIKHLHEKIVHKYRVSMKQAAFERNVVALERKKDAKLFILVYVTSEGVSRLHISKESIISYYMSFMVPQGSPYLIKFNSLMIHFFEIGLVQKWYDDIASSVTTTTVFRNVGNESVQKPFSLHDIQSAFIILVFGFTVGLIVFIYEIIALRFKKM